MIAYIKYGGIALVAALLVFAGWKWRDYQATAEHLQKTQEFIEEKDQLLKDYADQADATQKQLLDIQAKKQKVRVIYEKEFKNPGYDCLIPAGGLRILTERTAESLARHRDLYPAE